MWNHLESPQLEAVYSLLEYVLGSVCVCVRVRASWLGVRCGPGNAETDSERLGLFLGQ